MSDPVNEMAALDAIRELVGAVISLGRHCINSQPPPPLAH